LNNSAKQPLHKIDVGTLGPNPCQITLNQILIELNSPRITNRITSRYHKLHEGLRRLAGIKPRGFCVQIMCLYHERQISEFKKHYATFNKATPEDADEDEKLQNKRLKSAYTLALCCYKMLLKQAIKRLEDPA